MSLSPIPTVMARSPKKSQVMHPPPRNLKISLCLSQVNSMIVDPKHPSRLSRPTISSFRRRQRRNLDRRCGHIPFDSRCVHCQRSRSVIRHPRVVANGRPPQDHKLLLVQADFMFMDTHKFLVMSNAGTGLMGVAGVDSNPDRTISDCRQFFRQMGVTESSPFTIEVLTVSEPALGSLLRRLSLPIQIKSASPQAHETVGLAERSVRRIKEMISCIRCDMKEHGFDVTCTSECFLHLMHYVAQTHNCFGLGSASGQSDGLGSRRSPIELVVRKERPVTVCSLFGSVVHAKAPDSIAPLVPGATRFIPAAYLHLRPNSLAHMVSSKVGQRSVFFSVKSILCPSLYGTRHFHLTSSRQSIVIMPLHLMILHWIFVLRMTRSGYFRVSQTQGHLVLGSKITDPQSILLLAILPHATVESTRPHVVVDIENGSKQKGRKCQRVFQKMLRVRKKVMMKPHHPPLSLIPRAAFDIVRNARQSCLRQGLM